MSKRKFVILFLAIVLVLIGATGFAWAYFTGKISPRADVISNLPSVSAGEIEKSGFILVNLSPDIPSETVADISSESLNSRSSSQKEFNKRVEEQINSTIIAKKINDNNFDLLSLDNIVLLIDSGGNPILPDAQRVRKKKQLFKTENNLTFEYADDWQGAQLEQLKSAVGIIYPKIKELYGAPAFSNTVKILKNSQTNSGSVYSISTNTIEISIGGNLNTDFNINSSSFKLLAHEMVHSFHDDYCFFDKNWEEGMTEAVTDILLDKINNTSSQVGYESRYDFNNTPQNKFSANPQFAYYQGGAAWAKIYWENNNFFKLYNQNYYSLMGSISQPDKSIKEKVLFDLISEVEGKPIWDWYATQHIFHSYNNAKFRVETNSFSGIFIDTFGVQKSLNVKLYDFNNNLIGEKDVNTTSELWGTSVYLSYADLGFNNTGSQLLKITITCEEQEDNIFASNLSESERQGIHGLTSGINSGSIKISKLSDSSFSPVTKNIVNGVFSFGTISVPAGRYELTYQDASGNKVAKRVINKSNGNYYALLSYHDQDEYNTIVESLDGTEHQSSAGKLTAHYQLPSTLISHVGVYGVPPLAYSQSGKQYGNNITQEATGLQPGSDYNYTIYAFLSDNFMIKSNSIDFRTKEKSLEISSVTPSEGSAAIEINNEIKVAFNKPVDPNYGQFTLTKLNGGAVSGNISYDTTHSILTFSPTTSLEYNTEYVVTVSGFVDVDGNELAWENKSWKYTTKLAPGSVVAPAILSTTPTMDQIDYDYSGQIIVKFNTELDTNTILGSLKVNAARSISSISGQTLYNNSTKTLTFIPTKTLSYNTKYFVSVSALKDKYGNNFIPVVNNWSFITKAKVGTTKPEIVSIEPAGDSRDNPANKSIKINFNVKIDAASVPSSFFYVNPRPSGENGTMFLENDRQTLTYKPVSIWKVNSKILVGLNSDLRDSNGNYVFPDRYLSWSFYTNNRIIGAADEVQSQISADPTSIAADNKQQSKVTITLKDFQGNPVIGHNVRLYSDHQSDTIIQPYDKGGGGNTDGGGMTFGYISSGTPGHANVSAIDITSSAQNITLLNKANIDFITGIPLVLAKNWNFVAFPYSSPNIVGLNSEPIYTILPDGSWQKTDYQHVMAGFGYFVLANSAKTFYNQPGIEPTSPLSIPLSNGYNAIGNPFNSAVILKVGYSKKVCILNGCSYKCSLQSVEVPLLQAISDNVISKEIRSYDAQSQKYLVLNVNDNPKLTPYQGYLFRALQDNVILILKKQVD